MTNDYKDIPPKTLHTPGEAAGYLGVSVKTVYNWAFMGVLQTTYLNGTVLRIFRHSIISLIERGTDPDASKRTRQPAPPRSNNGKRKVIDPGIKR